MIAIWDNRLAIGDTAIDAEHRLVLDLLNEMHVAFTVRVPKVVVLRALETLARTVDRHFARDSFGTPDIAEHAAFASMVHRLLADWRSGETQEIDRRTLMNLARRWIDHMGRRETRLHGSMSAVIPTQEYRVG
jgi:hemerythrin